MRRLKIAGTFVALINTWKCSFYRIQVYDAHFRVRIIINLIHIPSIQCFRQDTYCNKVDGIKR